MVHPELTQLLDIQDMERELKELKVQADLVSTPLEKTRARRVALRGDMRTLKEKLERLQKQRREAEAALNDAETRVRTARDRQSTATSAREVSDLERMESQAGEAVTLAEESVFSLMEREDELTRKVSETEQRTQSEFDKIDAEMERLSALLTEKQDLAKSLREERLASLNRLNPETREYYEWLVKKHGPAQAIAYVEGGACGGCGSALLPDQMAKVADTSQLYRCTHCYRFVVSR